MAKKYREQCESNLYHITARGVSKQIIFEDGADRRFFGKKMREYLDECGIELYAWCFMSNHVHLLVRAELEVIVTFMRKLLTSYARYFNERYDRTGHLFQNRFDSVPVTTDAQLMVVVRYIHKNPDKIPGQSYRQYEWSSYHEYVSHPFISHIGFVMEVFGGIDGFVAFHSESGDENECTSQNRGNSDCASGHASERMCIPDEEAVIFAKKLLEVHSITSIAMLDKKSRNRCLSVLRKAGLPISQIARITGIGRNIVQRAK